ncbi:MAG: RICIN domain-containing protein [Terracidiphilus sp.]|jgi:hypothetical protein
MKRLIWALPLFFVAGCGYTVTGNLKQIQVAIYTPDCVDIIDASTDSGAGVGIYACGAGKRSQEWTVEPVDANADVIMINENSGMCMTVAQAPGSPDTAPGQLVVQEPCAADNNDPTQLWKVVPAPSGEAGNQIVSLASQQCLDLPYGAVASIYNLQQFTCTNDDPAQGWVLAPGAPGDTP